MTLHMSSCAPRLHLVARGLMCWAAHSVPPFDTPPLLALHALLLVLLLALQVAKAVEDILYAATQEEGEAHLAAAIAELEVRDEHEQEQVRAAGRGTSAGSRGGLGG